jgi:hypothetical protein
MHNLPFPLPEDALLKSLFPSLLSSDLLIIPLPHHHPHPKKLPFPPLPHAIPLALTRFPPICQIFPLAKSWGDLCNMYDCLLIPPQYECDLFMNTTSELFRHSLYDIVCVRDLMNV